MFVHNEQAPSISEGVKEIRINSHLVREITWQHDTREPHKNHEWPPFTLTIKESGRVLHHPSAIFHVKTLMGSPWVTWTLSQCTPVKQGKTSSNSTTINLLSLWDPNKSHMLQYTAQWTTVAVLNQHKGGYHLGALNLTSDHSQHFHPVFLTFP
jgi:hypothetical protein